MGRCACRADRFFSYWALGAHVLFALGVIPNTFLVAVFVLIGSAFHNAFMNKAYHFGYDFLFHWLPFLIFVALFLGGVLSFQIGLKEMCVPLVMIVVYLWYVGGLDRCLTYYSDHVYWWCGGV